MANEPEADPPGNSMGLKPFNQTGRADTTTQVLRPKGDPASRQRNLLLSGVVALAVVLIGYLAYQRSGLSFADVLNPPDRPSLGQGRAEQNFNKNE